jgi:GH25 family lysozyme M1 (1,4-beta-N-acetylmuramidase)
MTIFYVDISSYQQGIDLSATTAACIKATEGTTYTSSTYSAQRAEANSHGTYPWSYHFLHQGSGATQAQHAYNVVGKTPLMLDVEVTGSSHPTITDAAQFIDKFRSLGGVCWFVYLPKWYWQSIGSPSLQPLINRGILLVSSSYPASGYSDNGVGWQSYGGMTPKVWQFTSTAAYHGFRVDNNAFKGTLADLKSLVTTGRVGGSPPPPPPPPPPVVPRTVKYGDQGAVVKTLQTRLNVWGARPKLVADGVFGLATLTAVDNFQRAHKLVVDGIVGPATWKQLLKNP